MLAFLGGIKNVRIKIIGCDYEIPLYKMYVRGAPGPELRTAVMDRLSSVENFYFHKCRVLPPVARDNSGIRNIRTTRQFTRYQEWTRSYSAKLQENHSVVIET